MYKVATFHTKPVKVEAIQFLGMVNAEEIRTWSEGDAFFIIRGQEHNLRYPHEAPDCHTNPEFLVVRTPIRFARADIRDWVIKAPRGALSICKPDIFHEIYDFVDSVNV